MKLKPTLVLITLFLSLMLAACASGPTASLSGPFAGRVDGSEAFVAVILHTNGEATAYVCDSAAVSEWFRGSVSGTTLDLTNAAGAHLTADLSADSLTGSFTPAGGSALAFTADLVAAPAGLYRGEDTIDGVDYVAGWIVLPDGDQRGTVTGGGKTVAAPTIDTKTRTATGTSWVDPDPNPWVEPDTQP